MQWSWARRTFFTRRQFQRVCRIRSFWRVGWRQIYFRTNGAASTNNELGFHFLKGTFRLSDFLNVVSSCPGLWLWPSWQSGHFLHQRSAVRIPTSVRKSSNVIICQLQSRKDQNKEKEAGKGPFFVKSSCPGRRALLRGSDCASHPNSLGSNLTGGKIK